MLSEITGVSTTIWGLIWISIAIAVSVWLMRRAYKDA